ncbi:MAG: DUF485 domain-containing protein [Bryobacterales bacterium]|nr:DUF485 domain-containing protein [Bryobacterales bacterium]
MPSWDRIHGLPSYRRMIARKIRAVAVMTVFFLAYYFALPLLVGYWPELMARKVWGYVNWAYLFAFSQFLMAWAVAFAYMRHADRCDRMSEGILAEAEEDGAA